MKSCSKRLRVSFQRHGAFGCHSCGNVRERGEIYSTVKRQTEELLGVKMVFDSLLKRKDLYSCPRKLAGNGDEKKPAIMERLENGSH